MKKLFLALLVFYLPPGVYGQVKLEVMYHSDPVTIGDTQWLYYELFLSNESPVTIHLNQLQVKDKHKRSLIDLSGSAIQQRSRIKLIENNLQPGASTYIYLEIPKKGSDFDLLTNSLKYVQEGSPAVRSVTASATFRSKQPLLIGSPLSGDHWAAVYDPAWERGHRRVYFAVDNTSRLPGRFAIDFIKLDTSGRFAKDAQDSIVNWYGYAADVLAVEDGIITAAVDTFKESKTLSAHPAHDSSQATGNYISLKIAPDVYAFYEHLKPESIRVKVGDHVKAGQVIASLGFTGQSTGPHLHFHLADRNSPLGAEGIAYGFKQYHYVGFYKDFQNFGNKKWISAGNGTKKASNGRPPSNSVIDF